MSARPRPFEERFWEKVNKTETCWEWTSVLNSIGYGRIWRDRKFQLAHRVSWQLANGPIPWMFQINHTCDNRKCVRPEHLQMGTQSQNIKQAHARGRAVSPWRKK